MGQVLPSPISSQLLQRRGSEHYTVASSEMQGYRMAMEDTHTIALELSEKHPDLSFFAVFDGHAGDKASNYLEKNLYKHIGDLDNPTDPDELKQAMLKFDEGFLQREDEREDGSTCVFAVVKPVKPSSGGGGSGGSVEDKKDEDDDGGDDGKDDDDESTKGKGKKGEDEEEKSSSELEFQITVSNIGDSRAMIIRSDGTLISLTEDHKPENVKEEERIIKAGGCVQMNRVDGQLAMSRAIGDWQYKADGDLTQGEQKVIPLPDVTKGLAYQGDCLLICCDGIVEQMTNEDAAKIVHEELQNHKDDPAEVISVLFKRSLDRGSKDNHSALLIIFRNGVAYNSNDEFRAGPFHPFENNQQFVKQYLADAKKHGYEGEELMAMAKKTEESMPELKNRPEQPDNVMGLPQVLEKILSQPGESDMKEKLMMFFEAAQQGNQANQPNIDDEEEEGDPQAGEMEVPPMEGQSLGGEVPPMQEDQEVPPRRYDLEEDVPEVIELGMEVPPMQEDQEVPPMQSSSTTTTVSDSKKKKKKKPKKKPKKKKKKNKLLQSV